jgi:DNA recombination protein RmuC
VQIDGWFVVPAALLGAAFGVLVTLLWRARREQALRIEMEVLRTRLAAESRAELEREQLLGRAREQLEATFGELARDSLKSNSELFLQLARERLSHQHSDAATVLKERETAIEALVQPIREALTRTEEQIRSIERERIDSFATLKGQIESVASGQSLLSRETRNLVTALRRPEVRGRWGEITLRRLVELAGMSEHVDFSEQPHVPTEAGAQRPDMVVHMPERRDIVIDVKTPLDAYLAAVEAQSEEERGQQLRRHASAVSARVRDLASKRYWAQFEQSPDFVVLFLPGDQFLSAALQENPGLIDEALRQNVMLATPTSLVALLKTVGHTWRQVTLAENAALVRQLGEDLYRRLNVFCEHLQKLGRALGSSVESYNRAVGSLEQQVLPAARRFPELGLHAQPELTVLEELDLVARAPRGTREPAPEPRPDEPSAATP